MSISSKQEKARTHRTKKIVNDAVDHSHVLSGGSIKQSHQNKDEAHTHTYTHLYTKPGYLLTILMRLEWIEMK